MMVEAELADRGGGEELPVVAVPQQPEVIMKSHDLTLTL
jgi:hypothetical protein